MSAHAFLSPSAASRWLVCHGAPKAEAQFKDISGEPAAEGSAKHKVRSDALELGLDAYDFIGTRYKINGYEFECDEEWAERIQPGIDAIRDFGGELYVEERIDMSTWMDGQFGTLDAGIILPDLIVIDDAKYGRGLRVEPVRNAQLSIYALGFWDTIARHKTNTRNVLIRIDQPYLGGMKEWRTTIDELIVFGERVVAAAVAAMGDNPPRVASLEGCFYCRALGHCPEANEYVMNLIGRDVDEIITGTDIMPDLDTMPISQRASILKHADLITEWLDRLKTIATEDALAGNEQPGMKLVSGRPGNRKWTSEEKVIEFMKPRFKRDETFNIKLKSPAQLERMLGKRNWPKLADYVERADGKPILVDANDPRPALVTAHAFEVLDDIDDLLGDDAQNNDIEDLL